MTHTDKPRFTQTFTRLAVALRLPAMEAGALAQQVYYDALGAFPIEAVEDAARALALSATWFPKTSEWVAAAETARATRALTAALPANREHPWHHECGTCADTGWESLPCPGDPPSCGRVKAHAKHPYVVPCPCVGTNRTYQRKLEEQRQRSRSRSRAGADA